MTLLKLGGAADLTSVSAKALDRREKTRTEHKTTQLQQQQSSTARPASPAAAASYAHQSFCNSSCGDRCNSGPSSYLHQPYCNGTCGARCNSNRLLTANSMQGRAVSPQPKQDAAEATPPSYEDEYESRQYGEEVFGKGARNVKS